MSNGPTNRSTIGCREALRRLAAYLDGELEGAERFDVEKHLETCRSCYSRAEFEKGLKAQLGELRNGPVDADFEARIRGLIRRFPETGANGQTNE